jgi:acetolactate synthase I/II/III large subunit
MTQKNPTSGHTGGDTVAEFLQAAGVGEVYGIPGGHTLGVNDALTRSGIPFLTCRHEYTATCAAAAAGRIGNRAGVALVTCGPGVTNAATGVAAALRDGNPMLLLSVNNRAEHMGWGDAQDADAVAVLGSVSKWSTLVTRAEALGPTLRKAWLLAHSDRPGPVHVDLARDVAEGAAPPFGPIPIASTEPAGRAPQAEVAAVAEALRAARRPVLWIGRGAIRALETGQLGRLVRRLRIPVVCTFNAMEASGAFGELSFGVLSRVGTALAKQIVEGADLAICIGNSLNGVSTKRWTLELPPRIQVDVRADRLSARYPPKIGIVADAGAFCDDLAAVLEDAPAGAATDWLDQCSRKREAWTADLARRTAAASTGPVAPLALMGLFSRMGLDDGGIWSIDASNAGIWAHALSFRGGAKVMRPVNFSNMGFAIGGAIGMSRTLGPDRIVNVLIGDGSLGMALGDLETLRRLQLPVRIFVMNDSSLSNIRQEVEHKFARPEREFDFGDVRFDRVAAGFDIDGVRIDTIGQLEARLRADPRPSRPVLYDVVIDREPSVWTDMV